MSGAAWEFFDIMDMDIFTSNELFALANSDFENKRFDRSLFKLKHCLNRADCPFSAIALAARVYATIKLFEEAAILFQKYVYGIPSALTERFEWGMVCFESGKLSDSIEIWTEVLMMDPHHPPTLYYLAIAFVESGRISDSTEKIDLLLRTAPSDNFYFLKAKELLESGFIPKTEPRPLSTLQ